MTPMSLYLNLAPLRTLTLQSTMTVFNPLLWQKMYAHIENIFVEMK
jgi:hypothetical protein